MFFICFLCVSVDLQLPLFAIVGRKSVWEVSPSQQQRCPVIPILARTFWLVSCWFYRTWCGFYLNVFRCFLTGLGFTGESKHQNKFFPYGSLQPEVMPAKFVVTFADGWVDLPADPRCLWLVSEAVGVTFWLLGVVQLHAVSYSWGSVLARAAPDRRMCQTLCKLRQNILACIMNPKCQWHSSVSQLPTDGMESKPVTDYVCRSCILS